MPALYSHTTRATGTILTATIYNGDHQNHIDNGVPSQLDDYSANTIQMQAVVDPGDVGSESLASSLAGEIERLRYAIKQMKGTAQWYVPRNANAWEVISTTVPTAGNTVSIPLPTGYSLFRIHFTGIQPVAEGAANELFLRVKQNGVTLSGAADYFENSVYWNSATGTIAQTTKSFLSMATNGTKLTEPTAGYLEFNETGTGSRMYFCGQTRSMSNVSSRTIMVIGSEVLVTAFRTESLEFGWVGGTNFATTGKFILEGMR